MVVDSSSEENTISVLSTGCGSTDDNTISELTTVCVSTEEDTINISELLKSCDSVEDVIAVAIV